MSKSVQYALNYLGCYIADHDNDNAGAWEMLREAQKELERFNKIKTDASAGVRKKVFEAARNARREGFYEGVQHERKATSKRKQIS